MRIDRVIILAVSLFTAVPVLAVDGDFRIATKPEKTTHYEWISFLSEGPPSWNAGNPTSKIRGRHFRVVFYEGAEEMPSTLSIEEITFGEEGCCRKLAGARSFKLREALKGLELKYELSEFEFVKWHGASSFVFRYHGRTLQMHDIEKPMLRLSKLLG